MMSTDDVDTPRVVGEGRQSEDIRELIVVEDSQVADFGQHRETVDRRKALIPVDDKVLAHGNQRGESVDAGKIIVEADIEVAPDRRQRRQPVQIGQHEVASDIQRAADRNEHGESSEISKRGILLDVERATDQGQRGKPVDVGEGSPVDGEVPCDTCATVSGGCLIGPVARALDRSCRSCEQEQDRSRKKARPNQVKQSHFNKVAGMECRDNEYLDRPEPQPASGEAVSTSRLFLPQSPCTR